MDTLYIHRYWVVFWSLANDGSFSFPRKPSCCYIGTFFNFYFVFFFPWKAYMFSLGISNMNVKLDIWKTQVTHYPVLSLLFMSFLKPCTFWIFFLNFSNHSISSMAFTNAWHYLNRSTYMISMCELNEYCSRKFISRMRMFIRAFGKSWSVSHPPRISNDEPHRCGQLVNNVKGINANSCRGYSISCDRSEKSISVEE